MKNINWKVRFKNPHFWVAMVSMLLLLTEQIAVGLGYELPIDNDQVLSIVRTVLAILGALGVVEDMTTRGVSDSAQALTYTSPRKDDK